MFVGEKMKNKKRFISILGVVLSAIFVFFIGFGACWFTLDSEMRTLIQVKRKIDREYYQEISNDLFYDAVFDAVNNSVLDGYSEYMNPDDYADVNADLAGNRSGLGVVFLTRDSEDNPQMLVSRVCGNSPAASAGIVEGDKLIAFGKTQSEMQESVVFDEFSRFLNSCKENEDFYLKLQTQDGEKVISIAKRVYVESYLFYRTNTQAYTFTGASANKLTEFGAPIVDLPEDTAYIRIIRFTGNVASQFKQAMALFKEQGKKNLVLDLRGNGGGLLDVMQEIGAYLCKNTNSKKPILAVADYGDSKEIFRAKGNLYSKFFQEDSRVCVIADIGTASASEALIGAMLDYGTIAYSDICLIEEDGAARTYGKGIMQTTYIMNWFTQDALKLTTATIRWPVSNTCIHGRGIVAADGTHLVPRMYGYEPELSAAIKTLFA
jgi:carboxyl-terminal processing protease